MPSDTHQTLYKALADIAARVKPTLEKEDPAALLELAEAHRMTMDQLRRAGLVQDPGLLEQVKKTRDQVNLAIAHIHRQRDELGRQLGMREKKKTALAAYAGNITAR